jgi:hypothetical protein
MAKKYRQLPSNEERVHFLNNLSKSYKSGGKDAVIKALIAIAKT